MNSKRFLDPPASNEIEVSLFGPGYGECIVVHIGAEQWIVIDSCTNSETNNPIALDYLSGLDVDVSKKVKYLICSHWHDDHIRGFGKLVKECVKAKVVLSAALNSDEAVQLISAYSDSHNTMMESPGTKELYLSISNLNKRKEFPIWALKDRTIAEENINLTPKKTVLFKIASLSPSDYSIMKAQRSFLSMFPDESQPKRGLKSQNSNHSSVVTYIEIGKIGILLGGDLEVTGKSYSGWDCIINNRQIQTKKSFAYKVAHHGSKTGHHDSIWSDMLTNDPVSIITPFRKGRVFLPQDEDKKRLKAMKGSSYITTSPETSGKTRRNRTVQKTIDETVRKHSMWQVKTGQIRIRQIVDGPAQWTVDLSDSAHKL